VSAFDLDGALRWVGRRRGVRARRPDADLPFVGADARVVGPILLDTCVYIDRMRFTAPPAVLALVDTGTVFHSATALQELLHGLGALDPGDPRTSSVVERVRMQVAGIARHRLRVPDADVLGRAALLAGLVCRLQGYARDDRLRALHDCVLFVQALKHGLTVLTANVGDFDVLVQLEPRGRVLFYRRG
jgi:predicted nucleic acid-binding protein